MTARFEGDEEGGPARRLAGRLERMDLGMRPTVALMPALAHQNGVANDDSADERVGLDEAPTFLGKFERAVHPLRVERSHFKRRHPG